VRSEEELNSLSDASFSAMPGDPSIAGNSSVEISSKDRSSIRILVVDDERTLRESCASILATEGFPVTTASRTEEAIQMLGRIKPNIVLCDLYLPDGTGLAVLAEALKLDRECLVIVMTGKASVRSSIDALRAGAWSYLPKPFSAMHLTILVGRAAHSIVVAREGRARKLEGAGPASQGDAPVLLGTSEAFRKVLDAARQVARTDAAVFITGESGTGKEMIAQFIHRNSRRSSREMVSINSAALPEPLLESEMFGHLKGAFTGATKDKKGLLEAANGGTLFLDEIAEMPPALQAKLLRVVQDGIIRRVGSVAVDGIVNVRFIAATNQDPVDAVASGALRKDLYYRLRVFPITIPPLRERVEDIEVIAKYYFEHFWRQHRPTETPVPVLSDETVAALKRQPWQGNVRQLRNIMEHTVVILPPGTTVVEPDILPFMEHQSLEDVTPAGQVVRYPLHEEYHHARELVLADFEKQYLSHVVKQAKGNLSDAARIAGVDRTTLYRLMEKHEVDRGDLMKADVS
jgi:DNA-binding NtrC family response regulator